MLAAHPDWQVFTISEGFRQLPMMLRLYGPTDLITEVTWSGALWDQLQTLHRLPEAQRLRIVGVLGDRPAPVSLDATAREMALRERGVTTLVESIFAVDEELATRPDEVRNGGPALSTTVPTADAQAATAI
jgi:hypothetical protein